MSHPSNHHGPHDNAMGFSYVRFILPAALLMIFMFVYSGFLHCNCNDESCCDSKEKCEKSCDKNNKDHEHHQEHGK